MPSIVVVIEKVLCGTPPIVESEVKVRVGPVFRVTFRLVFGFTKTPSNVATNVNSALAPSFEVSDVTEKANSLVIADEGSNIAFA